MSRAPSANGRKGRTPLGKPLPETTEEAAALTPADIESGEGFG